MKLLCDFLYAKQSKKENKTRKQRHLGGGEQTNVATKEKEQQKEKLFSVCFSSSFVLCSFVRPPPCFCGFRKVSSKKTAFGVKSFSHPFRSVQKKNKK